MPAYQKVFCCCCRWVWLGVGVQLACIVLFNIITVYAHKLLQPIGTTPAVQSDEGASQGLSTPSKTLDGLKASDAVDCQVQSPLPNLPEVLCSAKLRVFATNSENGHQVSNQRCACHVSWLVAKLCICTLLALCFGSNYLQLFH